MKNIKNIKIAIMELYQKAYNGEIKQEVAEYFIDKLDTIGFETNFSNKRSGIHSTNLKIYKDISDISPFLTPKISFEQEIGKKEINLHLIEDKFGENARKVFFMKQRDGSYIYLGDVIDLDKDVDNEIYLNLNKAILSPFTYEQLADDKLLFSKLDKVNIEKYKNFIDKNLKCICSMVNNCEENKYNSLLETWKQNLEKEELSHRIEIFNQNCEE